MKLKPNIQGNLAISNKYLLKIFFASLISVSFLISGCASVKTQYYSAKTEDTVSAYKQFLSNNPRGFYTKKAQKALDRLQFREAIKSGNTRKLEALLHDPKYPKSNYVREATEVVARQKAKQLKQNESLDGYQSFYLKYGKTLVATELEKSFDEFYGRLALSSQKLQDYIGYITRFPNGQRVTAARKRGEAIWWSTKSQSAKKNDYQQYLDLFPGGVHQSQVQKILEKIMWKEAKTTSTDIDLYLSYLDRFPQGPHSKQAKDNVDWSIAEKEGPIRIRSYLNSHQKGIFSTRARKILKTGKKSTSETVRIAAWDKVKSSLRQNHRYSGRSMNLWGSIRSGKTFISYKGSVKSDGKTRIIISNGSRYDYSGTIYQYYGDVWFPVYDRFFKLNKQKHK